MTETLIYFMLDPHQNAVKIGKTDRPLARLAELRHEHGSQIFSLLWLVMPSSFEAHLHGRFAVDHLHGEWFRYSPSIQQFLDDCFAKLAGREDQQLARRLLEENRHQFQAELRKVGVLLKRISQSRALHSRRHVEFEITMGLLIRSVEQFENEFIQARTQLQAQEAEIIYLRSELAKMRQTSLPDSVCSDPSSPANSV